MVVIIRCVSLILLLSLAGCGFHLRGSSATTIDKRIAITARIAEQGELVAELRRELRSAQTSEVAVGAADWVVQLHDPIWTRKVLAVEQGGRRQQLLITYSVAYDVNDDKNQTVLMTREITLARDFLFDPSLVLAMNTQEMALKSEIVRDAAKIIRQQLVLLERQVANAN